jgi:hypothetical protein
MTGNSLINIEKSLNLLGVNKDNKGTSTGLISFGDGKKINSYSPVDGNLIGSVNSSTAKDYEKVVQAASLETGKINLHHKEVSLLGSMEKNYENINSP